MERGEMLKRARWLAGCLMVWAAAWPVLGPAAQPEGGAAATVVPDCSIKLINEVILSAERPGILGEIKVLEGDRVEEGALLARIRDEAPRAAFEVARKEAESDIDIRFSRKAAEVARAEYEKAEEANRRNKGTVPEVEVRRALLAAEKATLEIEKAQHMREINGLKRDEAGVQVQICRIEAPFSGFISKVYLTRGATVRQGDPVIELVSTDRVKVEGYVPLEQVAALKPGQPVEVEVTARQAGGVAGQPVAGVLKFVDVKANNANSKVRVWAEIPNEDGRLRAGLTAVLKIRTTGRNQP